MREIELTQGRVALVDDGDFADLMPYSWYANKRHGAWYAGTNIKNSYGKYRGVQMHRFLLNPSSLMVVDHIDGDGLNNQRSNIRVCTQSENMMNQAGKRAISGYKGVTTNGSGWKARLCKLGQYIHLGTFKDPKNAARAYNAAALEYFGSFARLNILD